MDWTERRKELTVISDDLRACVRHLNRLISCPEMPSLNPQPDIRVYAYIGPTNLQEPEQEGYTVLAPSGVAIFSVQDEEEAANWVSRMNGAYTCGAQAQKILTEKLVGLGREQILDRLEAYLEDDSGKVTLPGDTDRSALVWVRRFRGTL